MGILLMFSLCAQAHEGVRAEDVGFVLQVSGTWFLDGPSPQKIRLGQALPAGGTIRAQTPHAHSSSIIVVLLDGSSLSCGTPEACVQPISLPTSTGSESSAWHRIVGAVKGLFTHQPDRYVPSLSRGKGWELHDSVVKLTNGQIDLSPAFKNMEKGEYRLNFQPISHDKTSESGVSLPPFPLPWDPEHPTPVAVEGLRPDLYKVGISVAESYTEDHEPVEVWVLVQEPGTYEKTAAAFQEAVALTKQWNEELTRSSTRGFLRAYLEYLAKQGTT
jgi:hypothetical protein